MSISATLMLFSVTATVRGVPHSLPASGSAPCSSNSLVTASQLYFAAMCMGCLQMLKHKIDVYSMRSKQSHHPEIIVHDRAVDHGVTPDTSGVDT